MQCGIFNSLLALLHTGWPNLSPLSFFVPKEWWKRYRNDCCSMRKEWRYGFQWKDFCNIGKTCKGSRCNPSATQELGYTGDTLTLHWKNVRYGVHRHGAGSKMGGAVERSWATIHHQRNSGSLSFLYHAYPLHPAQNDPTTLLCRSVSRQSDESGVEPSHSFMTW